MKLIKKLTVSLLVFSLLAAAVCVRSSAVTVNENGFGFEINTSAHEAKLVRYSGNGGAVTIPDCFRGYPVRVIGRNAFSGNTSVTDITFSDTNTTVEEYAFMNCTALQTVTIPKNVVSFGDRAFAKCTSLQKVTLLSDVIAVPSNMFSGCSALSDLTISESITSFGAGCFNGCSSLTDLDFVSNGAQLGSYAFNGTGAESVVLSDTLFAIPDHAFTDCTDLKYVTIPESVTLIQPNAFDFEKITIGCSYDSYAYRFAKENGYSYELLDGVMLGDTNGDGFININDVTEIQRHLAELSKLNGICLYAADVNRDDTLDILDATALQMVLAEYDFPNHIGEVIKE